MAKRGGEAWIPPTILSDFGMNVKNNVLILSLADPPPPPDRVPENRHRYERKTIHVTGCLMDCHVKDGKQLGYERILQLVHPNREFLTMPVMRWENDVIVAGCLFYDIRKRRIRASGEVVDILFRGLLWPVLGNRLPRKIPRIRSLPVIGQPDRAWVIMILEDDDLSEGPHRSGEKDRDDGNESPGRAHLIAGQISPHGGSPVRGHRLISWENEGQGFFRFHPAFLHPDGDLLLPGLRISVSLKVSECPEANAEFQGIWPAAHTCPVVSGFRIRHPGRRSRMIYTEMDYKSRMARRGEHPMAGFMVWADPESGLVLWAISREDWKKTGSLELVNTKTMETVWIEDDVHLDMTMAIPDGKWFSVRKEWNSRKRTMEADVLIGVRENYAVYSGLKPARHILGAFPLSGERWVLASDSWLILLNGTTVEDCLEIPLQPLLYLSGVLVSENHDSVSVIPRDWMDVSGIHDRVFRVGPKIVRSSGRLGAVAGAYRDRVVLVPSGKMVEAIGIPNYPNRMRVEVGNEGYVITDQSFHGNSVVPVLRFHDASGNPTATVKLEGFSLIGLMEIIPVFDMFLVIAASPAKSSDTGGWGNELSIMLFDLYGKQIQTRRVIMGKLHVLSVDHHRFPDASHVVIRGRSGGMDIHLIVHANGDLVVFVVS